MCIHSKASIRLYQHCMCTYSSYLKLNKITGIFIHKTIFQNMQSKHIYVHVDYWNTSERVNLEIKISSYIPGRSYMPSPI